MMTLDEMKTTSDALEEVNGTETKTPARKKLPPKALWLCLLVVVLAAVLAVLLLPRGSAEPYQINVGLYVKDGELHYLDFESGQSGRASVDLFDRQMSDSLLSKWGSTLSADVSQSGRYLFFREFAKTKDYDDAKLMLKDLTKPEEEAVEIDTGVYGNFYISDDDSFVLYQKGRNFYRFWVEKKESERLAEGFPDGMESIFRISPDRRTAVLWQKDGYRLLRDGELKDGLYEMLSLSNDGRTAYFLREQAVYKLDPDSGKETKLADGAVKLSFTYDGDALYYFGPEKDGLCTLYFYNGSESVKLTDACIYNLTYGYCANRPLMVVYVQTADGREVHLAIRDKLIKLGTTEEVFGWTLSYDEDLMIYYDHYDSETHSGDLYRMELSGENAGKAQLVAEDVKGAKFINQGDDIYYYKNADGEKLTFINGEKTDVDIHSYYTGMLAPLKESGKLLYVSDWDVERKTGTLMFWDGKTNVTVAEEAVQFISTSEGRLLYLTDYKNHKGDLYEWYNGETKKVAEGVISLASVERIR